MLGRRVEIAASSKKSSRPRYTPAWRIRITSARFKPCPRIFTGALPGTGSSRISRDIVIDYVPPAKWLLE